MDKNGVDDIVKSIQSVITLEMSSFENPFPKLTELENKAFGKDSDETTPPVAMEVPEGAEPVPEVFVRENADFLEGEYMALISPRERHEMLYQLFTHKMAEWLENPEPDPMMEEALRQSELMQEGARWVSRCYVEEGFITEEQRSSKLRMIGAYDPA